MYRFLKESVINYSKYNNCEEHKDEFRCKILAPLSVLCDIDRFNVLKEKDDPLYRETANLMYHLSEAQKTNNRLYTIHYELEYEGFEAKRFEEFDEETVRAQLKLIQLFVNSAVYLNE